MYCQRNPAWAGAVLGFGPGNVTIGTDGCYLTSDADLMTWAGHPFDPPGLNDYYKAHGIYVDGDLLQDSALVAAFPNLWQDAGVYHCESFPCDQNQLNNDDPNLYVIVELTSPNGQGTHFAPVTNWRTWTVADPWTGEELTINQVGAMFGWGVNAATLVAKVVHLRYIGGGSAPVATTGGFTGVTCPAGVHVRVAPGT